MILYDQHGQPDEQTKSLKTALIFNNYRNLLIPLQYRLQQRFILRKAFFKKFPLMKSSFNIILPLCSTSLSDTFLCICTLCRFSMMFLRLLITAISAMKYSISFPFKRKKAMVANSYANNAGNTRNNVFKLYTFSIKNHLLRT